MSLADLVKVTAFATAIPDRFEELKEIIREADLERGAGLLRQLENENAILAGFIRAGLSGSPESAVALLSTYVSPEIQEIDGVHDFVARLQDKLRAEVVKPRRWLKRV